MRHEDNGYIPRPRQQHAIRVGTQLPRIADRHFLHVSLRESIRPTPVRVNNEVGAPAQQYPVQFQTLGTELGLALSQIAAGTTSRAAFRIAIPRTVKPSRLLPSVVDPEPFQIFVAARRQYAKARVSIIGIALTQVSFARIEVARNPEIVTLNS